MTKIVVDDTSTDCKVCGEPATLEDAIPMIETVYGKYTQVLIHFNCKEDRKEEPPRRLMFW